MKTHLHTIWLFAAVAPLALGSCALFTGSSQPAAAADEDDFDDEEAGVDQIGGLIRQFNENLRSKKFDNSSRLLRRAERAVQKADELTRSHPDFEDKERLVMQSRQRLEMAVEQDRLQRREAAIDQLIHRARQAGAKGSELHNELQVRVPAPEDLSLLEEILGQLTEIQQQGREFQNEARYQAHVEQRDGHIAKLTALRNAARWQLKLTEVIGAPISKAFTALDQARKSQDGKRQLAALKIASEGFVACVNAISDGEDKSSYNPNLPVETRLGRLSVADTKKRCLETGAKVRAQADRLAWLHQVNQIVSRVSETVLALRQANDAQGRLAAAEKTQEALVDCRAKLEDAINHPGFDKGQTFKSALGTLAVPALRDACGKERAKLTSDQPKWRWQQSFDALAERTQDTNKSLQTAANAKQPAEGITLWTQAQESARTCASNARSLMEIAGADGNYQASTAFGPLTIGQLLKRCIDEETRAKQGIAQARQDVQMQALVKDLQGDEIVVARREGIPSRIDAVQGGRVFTYQSGRQSKVFEFDATGKQVSFTELWRQKVQRIAERIDSQLAMVAKAANGKERLARTEEAMEWLEKCKQALASTEAQPGFDGRHRFKTTLGQLNAPALRDACFKQREKLADTLVQVNWHIRFDLVAARVQEAMQQITQASAAAHGKTQAQKSAANKVAILAAAIGGFIECVERLDTLSTEPGYSNRLKISTPFGSQDLGALSKACAQEKSNAEQALDIAMGEQKLEEFIAKAKGDEKDVARREGMPTRVETVGSGRVFVYTSSGRKKSADKRFAFDANGKRVTEKVLQAQ